MIRTLLLGMLLLVANSAASQAAGNPNEAAIIQKMSDLIGPNAQHCGLIKRGQSVRQGWLCAKSFDSKGAAFWLAAEDLQTDSAVRHIIARSASGKRYVIFYTSNKWGQPQFEPSFSVQLCPG